MLSGRKQKTGSIFLNTYSSKISSCIIKTHIELSQLFLNIIKWIEMDYEASQILFYPLRSNIRTNSKS